MLPEITRWSLSSLARLSAKNPDTARHILTDVANRLAWQQFRLQRFEQETVVSAATRTATRRTNDNNNHHHLMMKNLRHLHYLHQDTEQLCRQLLASSLSSSNKSSSLFDRWKISDQQVVAKTLEQVRDRHASTMERWVDLIDMFDEADIATVEVDKERVEVEQAVYQMVQARWGIQLLCTHYVDLYKGQRPNGAVSVDCNLLDVIAEAIVESKHVCEAHWLTSPEVIVVPTLASDNGEAVPFHVTLIRSWMNHTLVELIKNGMHSSVQQALRSKNNNTNQKWHIDPASRTTMQLSPPDMRIELTCVQETTNQPPMLMIDIVDQGVGLPPNEHDDDDKDCVIEQLFRLGHSGGSASSKRWDRLQDQQSYAAVRSPMSSLGVGLSVSRMMMRHFGGDVQLLGNHEVGCRSRIWLLDPNILECEV